MVNLLLVVWCLRIASLHRTLHDANNGNARKRRPHLGGVVMALFMLLRHDPQRKP